MSWPEWITLSLLLVQLLAAAHQHGKPIIARFHNFWLTAALVTIAVLLLVWGGWFR